MLALRVAASLWLLWCATLVAPWGTDIVRVDNLGNVTYLADPLDCFDMTPLVECAESGVNRARFELERDWKDSLATLAFFLVIAFVLMAIVWSGSAGDTDATGFDALIGVFLLLFLVHSFAAGRAVVPVVVAATLAHLNEYVPRPRRIGRQALWIIPRLMIYAGCFVLALGVGRMFVIAVAAIDLFIRPEAWSRTLLLTAAWALCCYELLVVVEMQLAPWEGFTVILDENFMNPEVVGGELRSRTIALQVVTAIAALVVAIASSLFHLERRESAPEVAA